MTNDRSSPNRDAAASGSSGTPDLCDLGATDMARLVRAGDVSAGELLEAHIGRIEQVNARLNAVVVKCYDAAREAARAVDRRRAAGETLPALAGVPITVKECLDVADTPSTFGLASRAGILSATDDPHVARLKAAGAVVMAKTNVAQLLIYAESDNPLYGRTVNPWSAERTPGGSSGGEGAIVAARGSPLGIGTDIGGSVRIPAAFCGIASLKPTGGRFDDLGRGSIAFGQRAIPSQIGCLARRVDDLDLAFAVLNGGRVPEGLGAPRLGDPRDVDLSALSIACHEDDGTFAPCPAARRAVREAADVLSRAGARIVPWTPPAVPEAIALAFQLLTADAAAHLKAISKGDRKNTTAALLLFLASASAPTLAAIRGLARLLGQVNLAEFTRSFGHASGHAYWQAIERQTEYRRRFA